MKFKVSKSTLKGDILVPPSKSHTIRAAVIAGLAKGESVITSPLNSADTQACLDALKMLGAEVSQEEKSWKIKGFGGFPLIPEAPVDIKNSGTSLSFLTSVAALGGGEIELTGDESIRKRPIQPLLKALMNLGALKAESKEGNGCAPVVVQGRLAGGTTEVEGSTSQFISSLLIAAPLLRKSSDIKVTRLNERPYMDMTLYWLKKLGIEIQKRGPNRFFIPANQAYYSFATAIPSDFSSATFPLVAALMTEGSEAVLKGLDMSDPQGDKQLLDILKEMGGSVEKEADGVRVKASKLEGMEIDLNAMPDALPAMAVLGCVAEGETHLVNVPQARIKETDRIKVMAEELKKMGARIEEKPDGLIIQEGKLTGAQVNGHGDHRVVMALALAGLIAEGETEIDTAESVSVTYPGFQESFAALGAQISAL
jgi:3-phosphoshikimate 1-carboxyvinyltransferase